MSLLKVCLTNLNYPNFLVEWRTHVSIGLAYYWIRWLTHHLLQPYMFSLVHIFHLSEKPSQLLCILQVAEK